MSNLLHAAELSARLCDISHFRQSDRAWRAAYEARTGYPHWVASPHICARDALALIRIGKGVARWAVRQCNGIERYDAKARRMLATWTEADETACEKAEATAVEKANAIGLKYGVTFTAGGDPRGYVLKMHFPTIGGYSSEYGIA